MAALFPPPPSMIPLPFLLWFLSADTTVTYAPLLPPVSRLHLHDDEKEGSRAFTLGVWVLTSSFFSWLTLRKRLPPSKPLHPLQQNGHNIDTNFMGSCEGSIRKQMWKLAVWGLSASSMCHSCFCFTLAIPPSSLSHQTEGCCTYPTFSHSSMILQLSPRVDAWGCLFLIGFSFLSHSQPACYYSWIFPSILVSKTIVLMTECRYGSCPWLHRFSSFLVIAVLNLFPPSHCL